MFNHYYDLLYLIVSPIFNQYVETILDNDKKKMIGWFIYQTFSE